MDRQQMLKMTAEQRAEHFGRYEMVAWDVLMPEPFAGAREAFLHTIDRDIVLLEKQAQQARNFLAHARHEPVVDTSVVQVYRDRIEALEGLNLASKADRAAFIQPDLRKAIAASEGEVREELKGLMARLYHEALGLPEDAAQRAADRF